MKKLFLQLMIGAGMITAPVQVFAQGNNLYSPYIRLKNALVEGKLQNVAASAQSFAEWLQAKENATGAQSKLIPTVKTIAAAGQLEQQRTLFQSLSQQIIDLLKINKPATTLYVDYCPMKKAYWISEEKEIRNPYYGKSMLSCGKITDTIHP